MLGEINIKKFFTQLENLKKSDVNRHVKDNEVNKTTLSGCKHLNTIKELMKQFVDNFSLLASKVLKIRSILKHLKVHINFLS